jgi:hypothetical protein
MSDQSEPNARGATINPLDKPVAGHSSCNEAIPVGLYVWQHAVYNGEVVREWQGKLMT